MSTPYILAESLSKLKRGSKSKLKPLQFIIMDKESTVFGSHGIPQSHHTTTLRLLWEDGTASEHYLTLDELDNDHLPLDTWKEVRYFAEQLPQPVYQMKQSGTFDKQIDLLIHDRRIPDWLQRYDYQLCLEKNLILHSSEKEVKYASTRLTLQIPGYWMTYQSHSLPDESEISYLEMETLWFQKVRALPVRKNCPLKSHAVVLLSPDSCHSVLSDHIQLSKWIKTNSSRSIRLYHEWIHQQAEMVYIPRIHILAATNNQSSLDAFAPEAYVYSQSVPQAKTNLHLRFLVADLLLYSRETQLVKKVGWDGYGLAVPSRFLVVTS